MHPHKILAREQPRRSTAWEMTVTSLGVAAGMLLFLAGFAAMILTAWAAGVYFGWW